MRGDRRDRPRERVKCSAIRAILLHARSGAAALPRPRRAARNPVLRCAARSHSGGICPRVAASPPLPSCAQAARAEQRELEDVRAGCAKKKKKSRLQALAGHRSPPRARDPLALRRARRRMNAITRIRTCSKLSTRGHYPYRSDDPGPSGWGSRAGLGARAEHRARPAPAYGGRGGLLGYGTRRAPLALDGVSSRSVPARPWRLSGRRRRQVHARARHRRIAAAQRRGG